MSMRPRWLFVPFLLIVVGLNVMPAIAVYTHVAGDEVVGKVDHCERRGRGTACYATWVDANQLRHSEEVAHVNDSDSLGREISIRRGPLGAHTGSLWNDAPGSIFGIILLFAVPVMFLIVWWGDREAKATARKMLAPSESADVWLVGRRSVQDSDGRIRVDFTPGERGITARYADGETLFSIQRRGKTTSLLSPNGNDAVFINWDAGDGKLHGAAKVRRIFPSLQVRADLFDSDGHSLGSITLAKKGVPGVYSLKDPAGGGLGVAAYYGHRRWVLRLDSGVSPSLRDFAWVFLLEYRRKR